jgi:hypothetical protein
MKEQRYYSAPLVYMYCGVRVDLRLLWSSCLGHAVFFRYCFDTIILIFQAHGKPVRARRQHYRLMLPLPSSTSKAPNGSLLLFRDFREISIAARMNLWSLSCILLPSQIFSPLPNVQDERLETI